VKTMSYLRGWTLEGRMTGFLGYDPVRRTFQAAVLRGSNQVLVELEDDREMVAVGHIPDVEIVSGIRTGAGLVLRVFDRAADRTLLRRPDGSEAIVDGFQADVSSLGDVVYQTRPERGGLHWADPTRVFLRRAGASTPELLGEGVGLGWPLISANGKSVVFFDKPGSKILHCDLASGRPPGCKVVHTDAGLILGIRPGLSPDGELLPYFAVHGNRYTAAHALRLLSLRTGLVRDLGPIEARCRPLWSGRTLWIWPKGGDQFEIDSHTGRRTSRTRPGGNDAPCPDWREDKKPYAIRRDLGFQWRLLDDRVALPAHAGGRLQ
jgi:hypothetical protein